MPLFPEGQDPLDQTQGAPLSWPSGPPSGLTPTPAPTLALGAAARTNSLSTVYDWLTKNAPDSTPVPGYDPWDKIRGTRYEQYSTKFEGDVNPAQTEATMAKIDQDDRDRTILAQSGAPGHVAALGFGLAEPWWYMLPGGEAMMGLKGGLIARGLRTGAEAAALTVPQQILLSAGHPGVTPGETVWAIGENALLGGLIGSGLGFLDKGEQMRAAKAVGDVRRELEQKRQSPEFMPSDSANLTPARIQQAEPGELPPEVSARFSNARRSGDLPDWHENVQGILDDLSQRLGVPTRPHLYVGEPVNPAEPVISTPTGHIVLSDKFDEAQATSVAAHEFGRQAEALFGPRDPTASAEIWRQIYAAVTGQAPLSKQVEDFRQGGWRGEGGTVEPATAAKLLNPEPVSLSAAAVDAGRTNIPESYILGRNAPFRNFINSLPGGANALAWTDRNLKFAPRLSPTRRQFHSDVLESRLLMGENAETAIHFIQERHGVTPFRGVNPVDAEVRRLKDTLEGQHAAILNSQYAKYLGEENSRLMRLRALGRDISGQMNGKMNFDEFKKQIYLAGVSKDAHNVPEVQEAMQMLRKHLFDPVKERLQGIKDKNGVPLLAPVLDAPAGDQSFMPRLWNRDAIIRDPNGFDALMFKHLSADQAEKVAIQGRVQRLVDEIKAARAKGGNEMTAAEKFAREELEAEIDKWHGNSSKEARAAFRRREMALEGEGAVVNLDDVVDRAARRILKAPKDRSDEEIMSLAREIRNNILSTPDGRLGYSEDTPDPFSPKTGLAGNIDDVRGSLNKRGMAVPSRDFINYIHTDMEHVVPRFLHNVIPDSELLKRHGDIRMTDQLRSIVEAYDKRIAVAKTPKEAQKLQRSKDASIRDHVAIRDRIRGVYGIPQTELSRNLGRYAANIGRWNVMTALNSSVINRLTDIAQASTRRGLHGHFVNGWGGYIRGLTDAAKGINSESAAVREMLTQMGIGIDTDINHMVSNYGEVFDNNRPGNRFDRGMNFGAKAAMWINVHGPYTDAVKRVSGYGARAEFMPAIARIASGKGTQQDIERMAYYGISPETAGLIQRSFDNGGHTVLDNGAKVENIADWDETARAAYTGAMRKEAGLAVLQPGMEAPLWTKTPIGGLVGQFKSFEFAAFERSLLANLQVGDARALTGMTTMLAMGALSFALYQMASGRPLPTNPGEWIAEAFVRSGLIGPWATVNSLQAKLTSGQTDLFRLVGGRKPTTRRDQTTAWEEAMGPTFNQMLGLSRAVQDMTAHRTTAMDIQRMRSLIWFQNHFLIRKLLDEMQDNLTKNFGIKPMNRNPRSYSEIGRPIQ